MFVSKKKFKELEKKFQAQDEAIHDLFNAYTSLAKELNELKKPKEPTYFK